MFLHFGLAGQFGKNGFGQLFAELYAPLVKAVDAPNNALDESFVFVHGNQAAHIARVDFAHEDEVGRTVAGEGFVRNQLFDALCSMPWALSSARTSSGVLPRMKASAWAKTLASRFRGGRAGCCVSQARR